MSRAPLFLSVCLALCLTAIAQTNPNTGTSGSKFGELEFLLGNWESRSASGEPGKASAGEASFHYELNGQVIVRRSFAEYGKRNRHEDLLYIFRDNPGAPLRATYFDSEGHVIHYNVTTSPNTAIFDSDPAQPGPRFRLSYQLAGANLNGKFEIAAPGTQDYKTYLTWSSSKRK